MAGGELQHSGTVGFTGLHPARSSATVRPSVRGSRVDVFRISVWYPKQNYVDWCHRIDQRAARQRAPEQRAPQQGGKR